MRATRRSHSKSRRRSLGKSMKHRRRNTRGRRRRSRSRSTRRRSRGGGKLSPLAIKVTGLNAHKLSAAAAMLTADSAKRKRERGEDGPARAMEKISSQHLARAIRQPLSKPMKKTKQKTKSPLKNEDIVFDESGSPIIK